MEASSLLILESALESTFDLRCLRKLIKDFVSGKIGSGKIQQIPDGMSFLRYNLSFLEKHSKAILVVFPEGTFTDETRYRELALTCDHYDGGVAYLTIEEEPVQNCIATYIISTDVMSEECNKEVGLYFN